MCLRAYSAANLLGAQIQETHQNFSLVPEIMTSVNQMILNNTSMTECWEGCFTAMSVTS